MYSHFFTFVLLHLFLMVNVVAVACVSVLQHVLIAALHDGTAETLTFDSRGRGLCVRIRRRLSALV